MRATILCSVLLTFCSMSSAYPASLDNSISHRDTANHQDRARDTVIYTIFRPGQSARRKLHPIQGDFRGVVGFATTLRPPRHPAKGQYVCGNRLCEVPIGFRACEDCQYKIE